MQDYEQEKLLLFIDNLHSTDFESCDEITPFFVRRSVYLAFFDKLNDSNREGQNLDRRTTEST